ncbi:MAG: beta-galactosidase [Candidatus Coatesbacteria bacterium]
MKALAFALLLTAPAMAGRTILDFTPGYDLAGIEQNDVRLTLTTGGTLRVESGHAIDWPGITIKAPGGHWTFSGTGALSMDVFNPGATPVEVGLRIDNPGGYPGRNCVQEVFTIEPGQRTTVATKFKLKLPDSYGLFGMNGYPDAFGFYTGGDQALDPANVSQLIIFVPTPKEDHVFEIARIRTTGDIPPLPSPATFFPFIDEFGQYVHREWPGKLHSATEFADRIAAEDRDLAAHGGPKDRDRWGGWTRSQKLRGTGFFRVLRVGATWWLVDPDGRLFWSHGVDCVGTWGATIVDGRERWFSGLPPHDDPVFGDNWWESKTKGNSHWKGEKAWHFDFGAANARRKYGEKVRDLTTALAHRRLRSWGLNTIGMWSGEGFTSLRRTPYVGTIHWWAPEIEGSEAHRARFYDVFSPECRKSIRARLADEKGKAAGDPWCLGFFVDNELSWPGGTGLAEATLASPMTQPAKKAFIADLRKKYSSIAKLNKTWGTAHASWDALALSRTPPGAAARKDLEAFTQSFADRYFRECRDAVKAVAPHQLYLGCRFAGWAPDYAARAAAKSCDVVSYNLYRRSVAEFQLPAGCADKPVIIGEFHCGALDRGLFHTGLQGAANQAERADFYRNYVTSALRNPVFVGAAWFQYMDQATTGRDDGENYQIGFVDITDTPYPETIAAVREIGDRLYELRR